MCLVFLPAAALRMFPHPLHSSVCIFSSETGLKSGFRGKRKYCGLVWARSLVMEKIQRNWISS